MGILTAPPHFLPDCFPSDHIWSIYQYLQRDNENETFLRIRNDWRKTHSHVPPLQYFLLLHNVTDVTTVTSMYPNITEMLSNKLSCVVLSNSQNKIKAYDNRTEGFVYLLKVTLQVNSSTAFELNSESPTKELRVCGHRTETHTYYIVPRELGNINFTVKVSLLSDYTNDNAAAMKMIMTRTAML